MDLFVNGTTKKWNLFLSNCLERNNLDKLIATRIGLQMGMATVSNKNLNTDSMNNTFCRWIGSLDSTARKIIKIRNPMPTDNPFVDKQYKTLDWIKAKKDRDAEFEKYLQRCTY